jgi:hypothetical protein
VGGEERQKTDRNGPSLEDLGSLGNKVMVGTVNASRENFEAGVKDLAMASALWPGWLERLLTHRVDGLSNCLKAFELLGAPGVIKVFVEVARG